MTVKTREEAWKEADKLFPFDYEKDNQSSSCAGYDIYRSTAGDHPDNWISDLGNRLEVNTEDGKSVNIFIDEDTMTAMTNDFEAFVSDLAVFAEDFVMPIKEHLVSQAFVIYKDKTIVWMLHEYAVRVEKVRKNLKMDMLSMLRHPDQDFKISEPCSLYDPEPYWKVLNDLLVNEWWHNQQKEAE